MFSNIRFHRNPWRLSFQGNYLGPLIHFLSRLLQNVLNIGVICFSSYWGTSFEKSWRCQWGILFHQFLARLSTIWWLPSCSIWTILVNRLYYKSIFFHAWTLTWVAYIPCFGNSPFWLDRFKYLFHCWGNFISVRLGCNISSRHYFSIRFGIYCFMLQILKFSSFVLREKLSSA